MTDSALRYEAINVLMRTLGAIDTKRFISMVKRDTFDYTEWQRKLWLGRSIDEIHALATKHEKELS